MVSNVTVHKPRTRVVCLEGDDHVAALREKHDVSSGRVVELWDEAVWEGFVGDLGYDGEVVAVEVDLGTVRSGLGR